MDLIPIQQHRIQNEVVPAVNARDLHTELNIGKDFSNWIKAQIKRADLVENMDYVFFAQKGENSNRGRPQLEYILTLDAAKHIAMMSQSKKAKAIRTYFIVVEKKFRAMEKSHSANFAAAQQELIEEIKSTNQIMYNLSTAVNELAKTVSKLVDTKQVSKKPTRRKAATKTKTCAEDAFANSNLTPLQRIVVHIIKTYRNKQGTCTLSYESIAGLAGIFTENGEPNDTAVRMTISRLYRKDVIKNIGNKQNRKLIVKGA